MMENRSCNSQPNISGLRVTDSPQKFLNDECFGRIVYTGYFVYITNTGTEEIRRCGCGCQCSGFEIRNEKGQGSASQGERRGS